MRQRSANEWRRFWATRGEREHAALLGRIKGTGPDVELARRIGDWFEHA